MFVNVILSPTHSKLSSAALRTKEYYMISYLLRIEVVVVLCSRYQTLHKSSAMHATSYFNLLFETLLNSRRNIIFYIIGFTEIILRKRTLLFPLLLKKAGF